jgi:transketolase
MTTAPRPSFLHPAPPSLAASVAAAMPAVNAGTPADVPAIDNVAINTIRTLSMDGVQAAKSGHPGTPMALAPVAYALWQLAMTYDPSAPHWLNRDRFVLSNGHASMLLYSLICLAGIDEWKDGKPTGRKALTVDDLRAFRQLHSRCPGHPEFGETTGVETTTGPLGQGIANAVGMAAALKFLAARYDRPGHALIDAHVWAICGDGDLEEGISHEAAGLAGHWQLDNLTWIYDDNKITIEGSTDLAYTEDVAARFRAQGWHVAHVADANDLDALSRAFDEARATKGKPTMIVVRSHIGWGAPGVQDKAAAHGEPLGDEELAKTKAVYGWPTDRKFWIPEGVETRFAQLFGARGRVAHAAWQQRFAAYRAQFPQEAAELDCIAAGTLPAGWDAGLPTYPADPKGMATRASGGEAINALVRAVPWMIGGSADLAPSTKTITKGAGDFNPVQWGGTYAGRNMHFGIREHAMGAIVNGMVLTGVRAFGAGFFIFSDYMRTPVRLSALMHLPSLWVFTHDSIGVGEDGPTHQPVEQLCSLRAVPNLAVWRPCDANEAVEAYRCAMRSTRTPNAMVLTRQNLPTLDRSPGACAPAAEAARGAYVLREAPGLAAGAAPDAILMASGSEVSLCLAAQDALATDGIKARVVSMPCWLAFESQEQSWRDHVLPPAVRARVAAEAGSTLGWERWTGLDGRVVGMRGFGASAPAERNFAHFGITADAIAAAARAVVR